MHLEKIDSQVIFDGEIVVLDEEGKSQFQLIQNYQTEKKGALYLLCVRSPLQRWQRSPSTAPYRT